MQDCLKHAKATPVDDARLLTLASLCSHGLAKEAYDGWHKGGFERKLTSTRTLTLTVTLTLTLIE